MPVIELEQEANASFNNNVVFIDDEFENNGTTIDDTTFETDNDRIYDVRGFLGFSIQVVDVPVEIDFQILFTTSHKDTSTLSISDFTEVAIAEIGIAAGESSVPFEFVRATPMATAFLLRLKLASAGSETIKGVVSAN